MANFCPKACSRLIAAAAFMAIGIVQTIAGLILLRSKYAYLVSAPNFWTAATNIAVGAMLGVSATMWKSIDKKSRHASKRKVLASLATSAIVLNGTTAAILIMGESNHLLSIHLENTSYYYSSAVLASEILAYAYAISVCSPIACIVISIVFLTNMCFQTKTASKKNKRLERILQDTNQIYRWVYSPKSSNPDLCDVKASSESGISSNSESSSSSSSTPKHPCYRLVSNHCYNRQDYRTPSLHQSQIQRSSFVNSNSSKRGRVCFANTHASLRKQFLKDQGLSTEKSLTSTPEEPTPSPSHDKTKSRVMEESLKSCIKPRRVFVEYPSGDIIEGTDSLCDIREISPEFTSAERSKMVNVENVVQNSDERLLTLQNPSDLYLFKYPINKVLDTTEAFRENDTKILEISPNDVPREDSKTLSDSEILPDAEVDKINIVDVSIPKIYAKKPVSCTVNERPVNQNTSALISEVVPIVTTERPKMSPRLRPVSTPFVSNESLDSSQRSFQSIKRKYRSKTGKIYHNYVDCNKTGLSSFRNKKVDEVDGIYIKKHSVHTKKSSMESITELPADISQPSTSTRTSGYMSAFEDESSDNSETEVCLQQRNRNFSFSPIEVPQGEDLKSDEQKEKIQEKKNIPKADNRQLLKESFQNVLEQLVKENPNVKSEEMSQILQASVR